MSERSFRRRILAKAPKTRPPSQPIPPPRRRTPTPCRSKPSKPIEVLERCSSEPILYTVGLALSDDENRSTSKSDVPLYRLQTCMDVFTAASSPLISPSPSSHNVERYNEEAKVVVSVTVEGSPGPVRTMVRLGSSVEDTIRLVVQKYSEEGRSPQLDLSAASSFQLHHSYFSLENQDSVAADPHLFSKDTSELMAFLCWTTPHACQMFENRTTTVTFQILVNNLPTAKFTVESVETVNNLISCTVLKIKAALHCENRVTVRRLKVRVLAVTVLTCLKTTNLTFVYPNK
ncbi:PREDICTED: uncharacterized protein LOC104611831 isoform X2 [Nelumbo nucifera]|uniref:Uncharacterized protein LOC104611831 isoform X2 n=1 Tax=Nelumbo nucifera TaxID=4432 RepID=A0A1U8BC32_NELNU|nr:PREDICTED: uncharacterized protein LOC104611831 isoform X2 [Nelumbo nucifera]